MMTILQRMRLIDPNYGSQEHQRIFIRMYEARQEMAPCPEDHVHENACYRVEGRRNGTFDSMGIK